MSVCTYNYGDLKTISDKAKNIAGKCDKYADKIRSKITRKLSELERGTTSNTVNANYLAQNKIAKLGSKASNFRNLSDTVLKIRTTAKETDERISRTIKSKGEYFRRAHGMNVNIVCDFFTWFSISIDNCLGFIRNLKDGLRGIANWIDETTRGFKEWFFLDGGKYIVETVISVVLTIAGVIALVTVAIPAMFTATAGLISAFITGAKVGMAIWTTITSSVGVVTAIIGILDSTTKVSMNLNAYLTNESDPGWAKRSGSMGSFSDYLRKTVFDNKFGNQISLIASNILDIASVAATAVNIADIAHNGVKFFKSISEKGGIYKVFNKISFKTKNGKVTFGTFKYGLKRIKLNIDIINSGFNNTTYKRLTDMYDLSKNKGWKALSSMKKIMQSAQKIGDKGFKDFFVEKIQENLKEYSLNYKYISKIKDFANDIKKTNLNINYANN